MAYRTTLVRALRNKFLYLYVMYLVLVFMEYTGTDIGMLRISR